MSRRFIFVAVVLSFFVFASAHAMSSLNFQINNDSINSGGNESGTSLNFKLNDTIGELGAGTSTSLNFQNLIGYRFILNQLGVDTTPPVLSAIQAGSLTETGATITWITNESSTSKVDYGLTNAYGSLTSNGSLVTSHSVALSGLTKETTYHYRVTSLDALGNTATSSDLTFVTASGASIPPGSDNQAPQFTEIKVINLTKTGATITWKTDETSDTVVDFGLSAQYGQSQTGGGNVVNHSVLLAGLQSGTVYHFRVKSKDLNGNQGMSGDQTFTTISDILPLTISDVAVTNITGAGASVTWKTSNPSNSKVEYGTSIVYSLALTNDALVSSHALNLTGLSAETLYHTKVTSVDGWNQSTSGDDVTFTTAKDVTPPSNVGELTAIPGDKKIKLTWKNPSDVDFAGVKIVRKIGSNPSGPNDGTVAYQGMAESFEDSSLVNETTYTYGVFAFDQKNNFSSGSLVQGKPTSGKEPDTTPPANVTNLVASPMDAAVQLTWKNSSDVDFAGVKVVRKIAGKPSGPEDGTLIYNGNAQAYKDNDLTNKTLYGYGVFAYDDSDNLASGSFGEATPQAGLKQQNDQTPPANVTDLVALPGDGMALLSWKNPGDADFAGVKIVRKIGSNPVSILDGSVVYQGSVQLFSDAGLENGKLYGYGVFAYDQNNNVASGNFAQASPQLGLKEPLPPSQKEIIKETIPEEPIPQPDGEEVVLIAHISVAGGAIELTPDDAGIVSVFAGSPVEIEVTVQSASTTPDSGYVTIGSSVYPLASSDGVTFQTSVIAPSSIALFPITISLTTKEGGVGIAHLSLATKPGGIVVESIALQETPVQGARVTLWIENGGWHPWNAAAYGQSNPIETQIGGGFAFTVPAGRYYVEVEKDGYEKYVGVPRYVDDHLFVERVVLMRKSKPILDVLNVWVATSTLQENVRAVAKEATARVTKSVEATKEVLQSPVVQKTVQQSVAPGLLTIAIVNSASGVTAFNALTYLQYLFSQPLLLIGRRKRKKWGVIYNALTKQPIELAIVRLLQHPSGVVVQTKITDKYGRYSFLPMSGQYRMEVVKPGHVFPTVFLKGKANDIDYLDLYHGDPIDVGKDGAITSNIALDPIAYEETPGKIHLKQIALGVRQVFAIATLIGSVAAVAISPTPTMGLITLAQVGAYLLFHRFSVPKKAKDWGIVFDEGSRQPLGKVIVRIFDKQFNKLLETQVTDRNGKFGFFARRNIYYLTAEKEGFLRYQSPDIDLTQTDETVIDQKISMKPSN